MSQAGIINIAGGGGGGAPVQTLTGDTGGPVPPTANNIFVIGGSSSENNTNGITVAGNAGTSTEVFTLTNRISGTATTTDAVTPVVLTSFALGATPATYLLEIRVIAYNVTDALSAGYTSTSVIRTTGAAASEISANPGVIEEEGSMSGVTVSNFIVGNTVETEVMGLAGKTIDWRALTTYIMVT